MSSYSISQQKKEDLAEIREELENSYYNDLINEEITSQEDLANFINSKQICDLILIQEDISKYKSLLGIIKYEGRYVLEKYKEIDKNQQFLKDLLTEEAPSEKSINDPIFLSFKTKPGFSEILGKKIIESFPNKTAGYLNNQHTLLIICKDKKSAETIDEFVNKYSN